MTEMCLKLEKMANFCVWNLNGIHIKFLSNDVCKFIDENEVLIITETHFGVRSKCPQNFLLIARSLPRESFGTIFKNRRLSSWFERFSAISID